MAHSPGKCFSAESPRPHHQDPSPRRHGPSPRPQPVLKCPAHFCLAGSDYLISVSLFSPLSSSSRGDVASPGCHQILQPPSTPQTCAQELGAPHAHHPTVGTAPQWQCRPPAVPRVPPQSAHQHHGRCEQRLWGGKGTEPPCAMIWALVPRFCLLCFENTPGAARPRPQGEGTAMAPWGQSSELSKTQPHRHRASMLPACAWHFKCTSTAAEGPGRCFFLSARSRGAEGGAAIVSFSLMYSSHSIISTKQPFHLLSARAALRRGV